MKSVFSKLRTTFFALLIGLPGAWGMVNCARALADHIIESDRMDDWVLAKATVQAPLFEGTKREYRYSYGGRDYVGRKLRVGGEDGMSFGEELNELVGFLDDARQAGKPVSVYVNPDDPAQSVVDRDVRTNYVVGMSLFTIFCASFAFGALALIVYAWFIRDRSPHAKAWREAGFLWVFGLVWSLFSFAITFAAVPDALADGEWAVLLVLLFPLIGILVLVSAVTATFRIIWGSFGKPGGGGSREASLSLDRKVARMGEALEGTITFPRSVGRGEVLRVRLECNRKDGGPWAPAWFRESSAKTVGGPGGALVRFSFDVPTQLPSPPGASGDGPESIWLLKASQAVGSLEFGFEIKMQPAARGATRDPSLDQVFGAKR